MFKRKPKRSHTSAADAWAATLWWLNPLRHAELVGNYRGVIPQDVQRQNDVATTYDATQAIVYEEFLASLGLTRDSVGVIFDDQLLWVNIELCPEYRNAGLAIAKNGSEDIEMFVAMFLAFPDAWYLDSKIVDYVSDPDTVYVIEGLRQAIGISIN